MLQIAKKLNQPSVEDLVATIGYGVNHRLKKIEDIANELRNKEFDSENNNEN